MDAILHTTDPSDFAAEEADARRGPLTILTLPEFRTTPKQLNTALPLKTAEIIALENPLAPETATSPEDSQTRCA